MVRRSLKLAPAQTLPDDRNGIPRSLGARKRTLPQIPADILGWWDMETTDETGRYVDLSGGLNGPGAIGSSVQAVSAKPVQALSFTSDSESFFRVDEIPGILRLKEGFTISLWVAFKRTKMSIASSLPGPMAKKSDSPHQYLPAVSRERCASKTNGYHRRGSFEVRPAVDTWAWIVLTQKTTLTLYINGKFAAQALDLPNKPLQIPTSGPLFIGGFPTSRTVPSVGSTRFNSSAGTSQRHNSQIQDHQLDPDQDTLSNREEYHGWD